MTVPLAAYGDGGQASAHLLRTTTELWACFSGMKKGATTPGASVSLRVDADNSRDALAQASDFGFFAGEDGDVSTTAGDGAGSFEAPGPGGLQASVSSGAATWNAELRIEAAVVGGMDHLIGLKLGHESVGSQGDDYNWPYRAANTAPNTWAVTALGDLPTLISLDPYTSSVAGPPFTLTVEGSALLSGTVVLWNGVALPTTFVDDEQLTAQIGAAQLDVAGAVTVTTLSPAPANFASNGLVFEVFAPLPQIAGIVPGSLRAGTPTTVLTIDGANFAAGAQVLWNGSPLPTTFVSGSRLTAQVDAVLLADGEEVGVAVRNQTPEERISQQVPFTVTTLNRAIFLPAVRR